MEEHSSLFIQDIIVRGIRGEATTTVRFPVEALKMERPGTLGRPPGDTLGARRPGRARDGRRGSRENERNEIGKKSKSRGKVRGRVRGNRGGSEDGPVSPIKIPTRRERKPQVRSKAEREGKMITRERGV